MSGRRIRTFDVKPTPDGIELTVTASDGTFAQIGMSKEDVTQLVPALCEVARLPAPWQQR